MNYDKSQQANALCAFMLSRGWIITMWPLLWTAFWITFLRTASLSYNHSDFHIHYLSDLSTSLFSRFLTGPTNLKDPEAKFRFPKIFVSTGDGYEELHLIVYKVRLSKYVVLLCDRQSLDSFIFIQEYFNVLKEEGCYSFLGWFP